MLRAVASIPNYIGSFTYATLPAAATNSGLSAMASDIGVAPGLRVISDGTRWVPMGAQVLLHSAIPVGSAPTGTMGNNGAVTLGTALDLTYTAGLYLYYPAGAIVTASVAGYYWTVMSSTTVGTVYNNTYTAGSLPVVPASPTAFVTTGPGAFTGITTAQDAFSTSVPANLLGINGGVRASYTATVPNNANAKNASTKFGGSTFHSLSLASVVNFTEQIRISNRGTAGAQVMGTGTTGNSFGSTGQPSNIFAIDTTSAQTLAMNIAHTGAATDWVIVQDILWEVLP